MAAVVLGAVAGCALLRGGGDSGRLAFSHRVHVVDEQLDCANCHETASVDDAPGMPFIDTCFFCHDELDAEKPPERTAESLFDEDFEFRAAHAARLSDEVVFSHLRHVEAIGDCGTCHTGIETSEAIGAGDALLMSDCTSCHAERRVANECASCHREEGLDRAPASHLLGWMRSHGSAVHARMDATRHDCSICHTEATCQGCHQVMPPRNHTNSFRRRLHGIHAMMERQSCAACHQPATCDACHQVTEPMNHVGSWGGTKSTHCMGCHLPLGGESCITCHKGTPSHQLATPKPSWHTPYMDCRQCHGMGQSLPHVDNGNDCNSCHL